MKNNKRRAYYIIFISIFTFIVLLISIIFIVKPTEEFSEAENRNLAQKPQFSTDSYLSKDYFNSYSNYVKDQFPLRNFMMSLKTKIDMSMGINEVNGVFIGKDKVLSQDFKISPDDETKKKIEAVNSFYDKNKDLKTYMMIVPTATSILKDSLPKNAMVDDELTYINQIKEGIDKDIKFIDTYDELMKNNDKYLYYKTDHHWTSDGAFIGYEKFCEALGIDKPSIQDYNIVDVADDFSGSLNSKIGLKLNEDTVKAYIPNKDENKEIVVNYASEQQKSTSLFDSSFLDKKDKYEFFMRGNHPLVDIQTLKDQKNKILVIKDSYANCFVPFLTENYGEIFVVDLRYYMDDINELIKDNNINTILYLYNANTFNSDDSILNLND